MYYLKDMYDYVLNLGKDTGTYEDLFTDYVVENVKLNMFLIHGTTLGQGIFNNYLEAYDYHIYNSGDKDPSEMNTTVGKYKIIHYNEAGYWLVLEER